MTEGYDCRDKNSGSLTPEGIVIHYTAGVSAESSAAWLCEPSVQASAHLVISRTGGRVYQLVPFNLQAWHAGRSSFVFPDGSERSRFNSFSIGIELDNAGPLTMTSRGVESGAGRVYPESEVIRARHKHEASDRYWHAFPEEQIQTLWAVCDALRATYDIQFILGHDDISPGRKIDPGPAFPMDALRRHVLGADRRSDDESSDPVTGTVAAPALNIRRGPGPDERLVALPLKRGQRVTIVEEAGAWVRVETSQSGWVSRQYIDVD